MERSFPFPLSSSEGYEEVLRIQENQMRKAIVLTSGGLDSTLTLHILRMQGVEPIGLHFRSWFLVRKFRDFDTFPEEENRGGFTIINRIVPEEYIDTLLHPRFGYGSGANPCVDCKLLFLQKARELLDERGASFVATGEVIGQRPMSQRPTVMKLLEKRSGLEGYLLRPLSARLLPPTIPEELGWIDRNRLFDMSGRSRKPQMELARRFGIGEYTTPAGGCLLAEPNFGRRFSELVSHTDEIKVFDLLMLKYGRHFRIADHCKLVVGKNQEECEYLKRLDWGNVSIEAVNPVGPFSRMKWDGEPENLHTALEVVARYSVTGTGERIVELHVIKDGEDGLITYRGVPDIEKIHSMLIR